jgi:hypothetical protein
MVQLGDKLSCCDFSLVVGFIFFMNVPDVLMGTDRETSVKKVIKHCKQTVLEMEKEG